MYQALFGLGLRVQGAGSSFRHLSFSLVPFCARSRTSDVRFWVQRLYSYSYRVQQGLGSKYLDLGLYRGVGFRP